MGVELPYSSKMYVSYYYLYSLPISAEGFKNKTEARIVVAMREFTNAACAALARSSAAASLRRSPMFCAQEGCGRGQLRSNPSWWWRYLTTTENSGAGEVGTRIGRETEEVK